MPEPTAIFGEESRAAEPATAGVEMYEPVAEVLFNELAVDGYFLEYDDARSGDFAPLRGWLRAAVHGRGSVPPSADARLEAATGSRLRPAEFVAYLRDKYSAIYGL